MSLLRSLQLLSEHKMVGAMIRIVLIIFLMYGFLASCSNDELLLNRSGPVSSKSNEHQQFTASKDSHNAPKPQPAADMTSNSDALFTTVIINLSIYPIGIIMLICIAVFIAFPGPDKPHCTLYRCWPVVAAVVFYIVIIVVIKKFA